METVREKSVKFPFCAINFDGRNMDPKNIAIFYSIMQFLRNNPSVQQVKVAMTMNKAAVLELQKILIAEPSFRSICIIPAGHEEEVIVMRVDDGGCVPFSFATEQSLRKMHHLMTQPESQSSASAKTNPIALFAVNWSIWLARRQNTVEKCIPPAAKYPQSTDRMRSKLLIPSCLKEIVNMLHNDCSVSIVCGRADSCKRTEVIHHLLEHSHVQQRNCRAICVVQDDVEVLAAAYRICEERNESMGNTVGYKLLINSQISETSNIVFCTVQTLILSLLSDAGQRIFSELTHLIVDGVERRTDRMNLLLTLLKEKLAYHPTVKLMLLSANNKVQALVRFYRAKVLNLPHNLPKAQFLPSEPYGVEYQYLETILPAVSTYAPIKIMNELMPSAMEPLRLCAKLCIFYVGKRRANSNVTRLMDTLLEHCWFANDAKAFDQLLELLECNKHMVDHPHSVTLMTPLMIAAAKGLVGVVRNLLHIGANPYVLGRGSLQAMDWCPEQEQNECWQLMHAAIQQSNRKEVKHSTDLMCRVYHNLQNPCVVDQQLVLDVVVHICTNSTTPGRILVLLPEFSDVLDCYEMLKLNPINRKLDFLICHRSLTEEEFRENTASRRQTSPLFEVILVEGPLFEMLPIVSAIDYVVDTGLQSYASEDYCKGVCLDRSRFTTTETTNYLKWLAQRKCFFLYSKERNEMNDTDKPLATVQPEVMLQAILCRYKSSCPTVELFFDGALWPVCSTNVNHALDMLGHVGAIDRMFRTPTKLGALLANIGIDIHLGKALLYAALFKCLDPMITIVAALKVGNPFRDPLNEHAEAGIMKEKRALHCRTYSDCMVLLRLYQQWSNSKVLQNDRVFVEKHHLKLGYMEAISNARVELMSVLRVLGIVKCGRMQNNGVLNANSSNWSLVKGCLAAGLYPQLAIADYAKERLTASNGTEIFEPHPLSVAQVTDLPTKWVIYARKIGNPLPMPRANDGPPKVQIMDNTVISDWTVLLMCGVDRHETVETGGLQLRTPVSQDTTVPVDFIVDRRYSFQLPQEQYQVVYWVRRKIGMLFRRFTENPSQVLTHADTDKLVLQIGDILAKEDKSLMLANVTGIDATPKIKNSLPMGVFWNYATANNT
uniref:Helicase-associated domain-containing protein n=1 Tax=Anopheles farauti TaxID=69004 RepID=A0A182QXX3_9DIPT